MNAEDFESDEEMIEEVCKGGFRLPTSDEWEYSCSAGSRKLFRWGNDCPADFPPYGKIKFNLHEQPNAFGLVYTGNPYNTELCEDGVFRQGDGGSALCGGLGNFASWIALSSAYQEPKSNTDEWYVEEVFIRRVFDIK